MCACVYSCACVASDNCTSHGSGAYGANTHTHTTCDYSHLTHAHRVCMRMCKAQHAIIICVVRVRSSGGAPLSINTPYLSHDYPHTISHTFRALARSPTEQFNFCVHTQSFTQPRRAPLTTMNMRAKHAHINPHYARCNIVF